VSDEDLSGESSTEGEEEKGGGAPPRRKLTKISDRDLSELKSDDGVTFIHFPFFFQTSKHTLVLDPDPVEWVSNYIIGLLDLDPYILNSRSESESEYFKKGMNKFSDL
jgi:hypothetical protein